MPRAIVYPHHVNAAQAAFAKTEQGFFAKRLRDLQKILRNDPDRRHDVFLFDWNWPEPLEDWGTGRYVYVNGDWVRP